VPNSVAGVRSEVDLVRHACLAFMLAGDDGLWNVERRGARTQAGGDREFFIGSNSWVFQSCGRVP
jgi:hypothetical protein